MPTVNTMLILAVDASETTAAVGLSDSETLLGEYTINAGLTHSETLLPMIESLLTNAHRKYEEIELFAASVGPGSFTGVRICAATVKGLAFGRERPCLPLSSLEVLAYNYTGIDGIICPVMDARRGQLYNALFRSENGTLTRLCPDRTLTAEELTEEINASEYSIPVYPCGSGCGITKAADRTGALMSPPPLLRQQNGYAACLCAYRNYTLSTEIVRSDKTLSPVYLRPSQAEREKFGIK